MTAADALPPGYGDAQARRVAKARDRIVTTQALTQALAATPQSDLAIAAAADRARADGSPPADPESIARCAGRAPPGLAPAPRRGAGELADRRAGRRAGWRSGTAPLLDPCHDARGHRARRDQAAARTEAFAALEQRPGGGEVHRGQAAGRRFGARGAPRARPPGGRDRRPGRGRRKGRTAPRRRPERGRRRLPR